MTRPAVWLALGCAVLCVSLMVWVWGTRPTGHGSDALPAIESHGLDPDQAACLRFGLVIRRSDSVEVTLGLGKFQSLDPDVRSDLVREVSRVDAIGSDYPEAAAALVKAFDQVADEDEAVLNGRDLAAYRDAVDSRSARIESARRACLTLTHFDAEALVIRQSGPS